MNFDGGQRSDAKAAVDFPLDLDQILSHSEHAGNQEVAQALGNLVASAIELTKLASQYETITSADDFLKLYKKSFLTISSAFEYAE
ncbi:hypothetical protein L3V82_08950 [Thiotrichales bacterium 19S3-7]|nr:hypothetical protein [Thiotrichales bacterium 19S3-7]MCF6802286.1 hypothetical protein [Thiotrichales bacterium 19S3-11]